MEMTDDIYILSEKFPKDEMFGLSSQISRAANSIVLNIAEGASGNSNPEFKRFLIMASWSCAEIIARLFLAIRRGCMNENVRRDAYAKKQYYYLN